MAEQDSVQLPPPKVGMNPGWYADPRDPFALFYWDGTSWIGERRKVGSEWVERSLADASGGTAATARTTPATSSSPSWHGRQGWLIAGAVVLVLGLVAAVLVVTSSKGGNNVDSMSGRALVASAMSDAVHGQYVYEVVHATGPKGQWFRANDEIGAVVGRQDFEFSTGSRSTVIVLDDVAYIRGNLAAIVHYFEIPTTHPQRFADRWIAVPATNGAYGGISDAVTLRSDFSQYKMTGPFVKEPVQTRDGLKVIPIRGYQDKHRATLYVTDAAPPLPVAWAASSAAQRSTFTISWSRWNVPAAILPPDNPIPITSVVAPRGSTH